MRANASSCLFQSTPPVKAATCRYCGGTHATGISIHAAREGGDREREEKETAVRISIHAAREGGDGDITMDMLLQQHFNPRRP